MECEKCTKMALLSLVINKKHKRHGQLATLFVFNGKKGKTHEERIQQDMLIMCCWQVGYTWLSKRVNVDTHTMWCVCLHLVCKWVNTPKNAPIFGAYRIWQVINWQCCSIPHVFHVEFHLNAYFCLQIPPESTWMFCSVKQENHLKYYLWIQR